MEENAWHEQSKNVDGVLEGKYKKQRQATLAN